MKRFYLALALLLGVGSIIYSHYSESVTKKEWLPDRSCMTSFAPDVNFVRVIREDVFALEGDEGNRNEVELDSATREEIKKPAEKPVVDENFFDAVRLMKAGRLSAAENKLVSHLSKNPEHSEGWRQLGDCRYNLGKVNEAFSAYTLALKNKPDNYLALRGQGVASLYLGYEYYDLQNLKQAHKFFQKSLNSLHKCLQIIPEDVLSRYGQALAAEGVSRELYRIAQKSINTSSHEQAKVVIRNCLDIIDAAVLATEDRISRKPNDDDAKLLLSSLLLRRARVLLPFGHVNEAVDNLNNASAILLPIMNTDNPRQTAAKEQRALCQYLLKKYN